MTIEAGAKEMERLITAFPDNMMEALKIGQDAVQNFHIKPVRNVLIAGLGGSGIGGKIMSQIVWDNCKVPVNFTQDYQVPAWVDEHTLFIACSYSGNTEETLSALEFAMQKNAQIACITAGGKVKTMAGLEKFNVIEIPAGQPPRTSLGYNAMQHLFVLGAYGLINLPFEKNIEDSIHLLRKEQSQMKVEAAAIAKKISGTIPVIYSDSHFEGVAVRFRQQINENAKMLCWHHALPEMNHNELVGWAGGNKNLSVLLMRTDEDHPGTSKRMDLSLEIIHKYTDKIVELHAKGNSRLEKSYYLIHLTDWVSYYLSLERKVDPVEIEVIDYFKKELAK